MGSEIIFPIGIGLGVALFVWLFASSFFRRFRPYSIPTLLYALVFALLFTSDNKPGYYWYYFVDWFCLGAILFGVHAHAIRWLVQRRDTGSAPYQSLEGTMNDLRVRAAGAGRQFAPAALGGRFWAAPQLYR